MLIPLIYPDAQISAAKQQKTSKGEKPTTAERMWLGTARRADTLSTQEGRWPTQATALITCRLKQTHLAPFQLSPRMHQLTQADIAPVLSRAAGALVHEAVMD
jgi:hypothetical protein